MKTIIESYHQKLLQLFEEYIVFGAYPEVTLINDKTRKVEKLNSIAASYIQKDIRDIANIENIEAYNNLLKYLSINSGILLNHSSVQTTLSTSLPTLNKYLSILKDTFIVNDLPPFFTNKNKEISKNKRMYYKDSGIRNLQIENFNMPTIRTDTGLLYKNYIFNVLDNRINIQTENFSTVLNRKPKLILLLKMPTKLHLWR